MICRGKEFARDGCECLLQSSAGSPLFIITPLGEPDNLFSRFTYHSPPPDPKRPSLSPQRSPMNAVGELPFPFAGQKKGRVIDDGVRESFFFLTASISHSYHLTTPPFAYDINCAPVVCTHMSGVVSEPSRSDEQKLATSRDGDTEYRGQRHYRIQDTSAGHNPVTMDESNEPEVENVETDISAVQKMLSAVSGSLLTSLLGIFLLSKYILE